MSLKILARGKKQQVYKGKIQRSKPKEIRSIPIKINIDFISLFYWIMPSFRMMLLSHTFSSTNVNNNQYFHDFHLETQIPRAAPRYSLNCTSASCCHKIAMTKISHCLSTLKMVPLIHYYSYQHINLSCLKQDVATP